VIEASLDTSYDDCINESGFADKINNAITTYLLSKSHQDVNRQLSAVIEWHSAPHANGIVERLEARELALPLEICSDLVDLKRFVEGFTNNLDGTEPIDFASIDSRYLSEFGHVRTTEFSNQILQHVISDYMQAYLDYYGSPFPRTLSEQVRKIVFHVLRRWREIAVRSKTICALPTVSIFVRLGLRLNSTGLLGSGIMFSSSLNDGREQETLGYYSRQCLQDVDAGIAPLLPLLEIVNHDADLAADLQEIRGWLATEKTRALRIGFIRTHNGMLVDYVEPVQLNVERAIVNASKVCGKETIEDLRAFLFINPRALEEMVRPTIAPKARQTSLAIGTGIAAAPGACCGVVCTDASKAEKLSNEGQSIIFVSHSPLPELIPSVLVSKGLIFATGGATSHVAVIARSTNKPCILGVGGLAVDCIGKRIYLGPREIAEGEWLTIDGTSGKIYEGCIEVVQPNVTENYDLNRVLTYCDRLSTLQVYVNADLARDASTGFALGAKGVGLCRVEHLLLRPETLSSLQRTLAMSWLLLPLSQQLYQAFDKVLKWPSSEGARSVLAEARSGIDKNDLYKSYLHEVTVIHAALRAEFLEIFECAGERPVIIRLLDPPLSEFISEETVCSITNYLHLAQEQVDSLLELITRRNPMLGLRGIRLCHLAPELMRAQVSAALSSAKIVGESNGKLITAQIMAPFVTDPIEITLLKRLAEYEVEQLGCGGGLSIAFRTGCMIETPRAAMLAGELAKVADFLSFGTNDLTQFVWSSSRDSSDNDFLNFFPYKHLSCKPFENFDELGVGRLVSFAVTEARRAVPDISIGVCGEHGRDPEAIKFFNKIGVNYVSCSPQSVPSARLAAAQAAILGGNESG